MKPQKTDLSKLRYLITQA